MSNSGGPNPPPKGGNVPKPRSGNASLTDAVVAALAKVDDGKSPAKAVAAPVAAPVAAEAGCAATTQAPKAAPPPPPAVVPGTASTPAPARAPAPPPVAAKGANGSNGAHGFRSGPGSFADLARRFAGGAALPVTARSSGTPPRPSAPVEPPATISEPPARVSPPPAVAEVKEPAAIASAVGPVEVLYYGRTDVGLVREHNEDNFIVADLAEGVRNNTDPRKANVPRAGLIFAVCDGMGGAAAGEVASQMAVDAIHEVMLDGGPPPDRDVFARRLVSAIEEAGHRIFSAAKMDRTRRGMGTTSTLAGLVDNVLFVGQVGDSRAYILRGDQFEMITKDQSLVNQLIEAGQLTEEEAEAFEHSNIILQALGTTEEVTVDLTFLEVRKGDRLLMCSDGLSGLVHADMIKEVLQTEKALPGAAAKLIQMANAGGGHDNITVILAEFGGAGLTAPSDVSVLYQQYPLPPAAPNRRGSAPPRETSIKAGGPKPGADVKSGGTPSGAPADEETSSGTSKVWMALVVLLLLVLLVGGGYLAMTSGMLGSTTTTTTEPATPPDPPVVENPEPVVEDPVVEDPVVEPEVEVVVIGTVTVVTDAEEGTLFVNDQAHGPLSNGMTLDLPPGTYTFRAMNGESRIAEQPVVVEAGQPVQVTLNNPEAVDEPPPERPRVRTPRIPPVRPEVRPLGGGGPAINPPPRPPPPPRPQGPVVAPPNPFG